MTDLEPTIIVALNDRELEDDARKIVESHGFCFKVDSRFLFKDNVHCEAEKEGKRIVGFITDLCPSSWGAGGLFGLSLAICAREQGVLAVIHASKVSETMELCFNKLSLVKFLYSDEGTGEMERIKTAVDVIRRRLLTEGSLALCQKSPK